MNRKIKALLIEKGIKQKEIAAELGVTPGLVSGVINGHSESRPLKTHIAKMLGRKYESLWGKAA